MAAASTTSIRPAGIDVGGLERSRGKQSDSIRFGPSAYGIERLEVYLATCAFEPGGYVARWSSSRGDLHEALKLSNAVIDVHDVIADFQVSKVR